jgi:phosphate transport system protein
MTSEHTVKAFDEELNHLDSIIAEMGGLAEVQLTDAIEALMQRDSDKAALVAAADARIDQLESEIDHLAVSLLALRQPMAADLRAVICAR